MASTASIGLMNLGSMSVALSLDPALHCARHLKRMRPRRLRKPSSWLAHRPDEGGLEIGSVAHHVQLITFHRSSQTLQDGTEFGLELLFQELARAPGGG